MAIDYRSYDTAPETCCSLNPTRPKPISFEAAINGPTGVVSIPALHHLQVSTEAAFDASAKAAADWFLKYL